MKRVVRFVELWETHSTWRVAVLGCIIGTVAYMFCSPPQHAASSSSLTGQQQSFPPFYASPHLPAQGGGSGVGNGGGGTNLSFSFYQGLSTGQPLGGRGSVGSLHRLPQTSVVPQKTIDPSDTTSTVKLKRKKRQAFGATKKKKRTAITQYSIKEEEKKEFGALQGQEQSSEGITEYVIIEK